MARTKLSERQKQTARKSAHDPFEDTIEYDSEDSSDEDDAGPVDGYGDGEQSSQDAAAGFFLMQLNLQESPNAVLQPPHL